MSILDSMDNLTRLNRLDEMNNSSVSGYAGALVADIGTSLWNSVTFGQAEISTAGLLEALGADGALATYKNHKDSIELLSFVGGALIPGFAALKLTKAVRDGTKGAYALSTARRTDDLAKFNTLVQDGKKGHAEYKKLRNGMMLRAQANNLVDTAAAEAAVMLTMNAHPFMEDYLADPVKNFGISMALGVGLTAPFTAIANRTAIRGVEATVETGALRDIMVAANLFDQPFADSSSILNTMQRAADSVDTLAAMPTTNAFTRELANEMSAAMRARAGKLADSKIADNLDLESRNHLKRLMTTPEFLGVDTAKFYDGAKKSGFLAKTKDFLRLKDRPTFKTTVDTPDGLADVFTSKHYYSPEHGSFIPEDFVDSLASAADAFTGPDIAARSKQFIQKELAKAVDPALLGTPQLEAEYLARIKFYDDMATDALADVRIVGDDLPAINGWVSAIKNRKMRLEEKLAKHDYSAEDAFETQAAMLKELDSLANAKITIADGDLQRLVTIEEFNSLPTKGGAGVGPDHMKDLEIVVGGRNPDGSRRLSNGVEAGDMVPLSAGSFHESNQLSKALMGHGRISLREMSPADMYRAIDEQLSSPSILAKLEGLFPKGKAADTLSPMAKAALTMWIGGSHEMKLLLRNGLESARTLRRGVHSEIPFHNEWTEILNHPVTQNQRAQIAKAASEDGHVYLFRGILDAPTGQASFSSYSHVRDVSKGFADTKLEHLQFNKIHMDDVLGYLYHGEREWLVGASTRENLSHLAEVTELPQNRSSVTIKQEGKGKGNKSSKVNQVSMGYEDAAQVLADKTKASLTKSIEEGMPVEVAAIRHNLTNDSAMAMLSKSGDMNIDPNAELFTRWNSPSALTEALSYERRIVEAGAKSKHHMDAPGELLDRQRKAIEESLELATDYKAALNGGHTAAIEGVKSRMAVMDNLMASMHREWIDLSLSMSDSNMARTIRSSILDTDMYKLLRAGLDEVSNSVGGNSLWQSADMVMRNMKTIGRVVGHLGDARGKIVNAEIERLLTPLSHDLRILGQDSVARTEFAMLDKFRHETKGTLYWDEVQGQFYTELAKDGAEITTHVGPATSNPIVLSTMANMANISAELGATRRTAARLSNGNAPIEIGFWNPSSKLVGKEYAYIQNLETHQVKLLVADNADQLAEMRKAYKPADNERIITRSRAELENLAIMDDGRIQKVTMADIDKTKRGITGAVEDISAQRLEDIIGGYTAQINRMATAIVEEAMHDVVTKLDYLSGINAQAWTDSGKTGWRKGVSQLANKDVAGDVKDYLLGRNPAHRSETLRTINGVSDTVISYMANTSQAAWRLIKPERVSDPIAYEKYTKALEAAGIPNPFEAYAEASRAAFFTAAKNGGYSNDPQRVVNAFNALASTTALKFAEIAQPLVNILSLPILMSSSISRMTDTSKLTVGGFFENSQMAIMMSGVRRMNSTDPRNVRLFNLAKNEGLLTSNISEVDAALRLNKLHTDKGALSKMEAALSSRFVEIMSKPSEAAEGLVRRATMGTAIELAIRNYGPNVSDKQILIFARDFMKQSIGNYSASQRPAMFQGSFGSAMGLFQTYMVTYAQNMYSHIEAGDRKGFAKLMLAQGGIFGAYSLPGFNPVSQMIGEHFSDEHFDITTSLYRALPDQMASTIVYGLPSNLVGALHTRGDVSPRLPSGFHEFVAPSMVGQYVDTALQVAKATMRFDATAGNAMLEALSTQSASRPVARLAELANGYSTTRAGVMVAGEEEVWSFQGIMARVLSTRTMAEAKAREAIHLNTVYGQRDRTNRQAVIKRLRQDLRASSLTHEKLDSYALDYLRTGTPQGWRASVNEAILANENKGVVDLTSKLKDSPLSLMLDDLSL